MRQLDSRHPIITLAFVASLLAFPVFAQQAAPNPGQASPEQDFLSAVMLGGYERVEYHAADGTPLTFDAFMQAVAAGKSFSMSKQSDHKLATVTLDGGAAAAHADVPESLAVGSALPDIGSMPLLDGRLLADAGLRGRYTLLSFFFAECVPCIAEVPALNAFAAAHPEIGAYAVTFDDADTARKFVRERGLALPVLADAQAYTDQLAIKTYPMMLLVDPDGRVAAVRHGGTAFGHVISTEDLDRWLESAIASAKVL